MKNKKIIDSQIEIDVSDFANIPVKKLGNAVQLTDTLLTVNGQDIFKEIHENKTAIIDGTIDKLKLDALKKQLYTNIVKFSAGLDAGDVKFDEITGSIYFESKKYKSISPEDKDFISSLQGKDGSTLLKDSLSVFQALESPEKKLTEALNAVVKDNIDLGFIDILRSNIIIEDKDGNKIFLQEALKDDQKKPDGLKQFLKDQNFSDKDVDYLFANLNQKAILAIPFNITKIYHNEDNKLPEGQLPSFNCNVREINIKVGDNGMESLTAISPICLLKFINISDKYLEEIAEFRSEIKFDNKSKDATLGKEYKGYSLPGSVKPKSVKLNIEVKDGNQKSIEVLKKLKSHIDAAAKKEKKGKFIDRIISSISQLIVNIVKLFSANKKNKADINIPSQSAANINPEEIRNANSSSNKLGYQNSRSNPLSKGKKNMSSKFDVDESKSLSPTAIGRGRHNSNRDIG